MTYRVEDIIKYVDLNSDKYLFFLREYASPTGDYHNEAVVACPLISSALGVIFEEDVFNTSIYYTEEEMAVILNRLNVRAAQIIEAMSDLDQILKHKYGRN